MMRKGKVSFWKLIYAVAIACFLLSLLAVGPVAAQDRSDFRGILIFRKDLGEGREQIVTIRNGTQYHVGFSEQQCAFISHQNDRVAIVDKAELKRITIVRLDGTHILDVSWDQNEEWHMPCSISWNEDGSYLLVDVSDESWVPVFGGEARPSTFTGVLNWTYYKIDTTNGEITGPHDETSMYCPTGGSDIYGPHSSIVGMTCGEFASQIPNLPKDAYISMSPNPRFVLFDRCASGDFRINSRFDTEECVGPSEAAVYSLELNELVTILDDAPSLERNRRNGRFSPASNRFTWSPSGHLLAYKPYTKTINVFDVQLRQYWSPITIGIASYSFDASCSLQWSPDESQLAFWLYSENNQNYIGGMFDSNTGVLRFMNESYPSVATYPSNWYWSPDNETLAFVSNGNLLLWDVNTGDVAFVEDNVAEVLMWIPE